MLAQAMGESMTVVAVGRAVAAVGASAYAPTASSVASALAPPERRGRALATVLGGLTLATVLGVPLGVLLSGWGSWRTTLLVVTALGVVAALGTVVVPPVRLPVADPRSRLTVLRRPGVLTTLLTTMMTMAGAFTVYTYLSELLSPVAAGGTLGVLLFVYGAAGVAGNTAAGRLTDRHGARAVVVVALASLSVLLLAWPAARLHLVAATALLLLWGALGWMFSAPQMHRLIETVPDAAPVALGWSSSATYAGTALGSLLGGVVLDVAGAAWLGPVGAAACALALGLVVLPRRRAARAAQSSPAASLASASRT
nr:hypothetical protein GCM10020241_33350 [Streptoalloteichus tenebrarius]